MRGTAVALAWCLALGATLSAHRLDEYLQAARIDVARDRIVVELDLTPGVAISPVLLPAIDRDGDGAVSAAEADAYATDVLDSLTLTLDGRVVALDVAERRVPSVDAMRAGVGTIQLAAIGRVPDTAGGRHQITFRNAHRPDIGVYLANALVPRDARIEIASQQRDPQQRELRIDYRVASGWAWTVAWNGVALLILIGLVGLRRRGVVRPAHDQGSMSSGASGFSTTLPPTTLT